MLGLSSKLHKEVVWMTTSLVGGGPHFAEGSAEEIRCHVCHKTALISRENMCNWLHDAMTFVKGTWYICRSLPLTQKAGK